MVPCGTSFFTPHPAAAAAALFYLILYSACTCRLVASASACAGSKEAPAGRAGVARTCPAVPPLLQRKRAGLATLPARKRYFFRACTCRLVASASACAGSKEAPAGRAGVARTCPAVPPLLQRKRAGLATLPARKHYFFRPCTCR